MLSGVSYAEPFLRGGRTYRALPMPDGWEERGFVPNDMPGDQVIALNVPSRRTRGRASGCPSGGMWGPGRPPVAGRGPRRRQSRSGSPRMVRVIDHAASCVQWRVDMLKKPPTTVSHKPPRTLNNARTPIDCILELTRPGHRRVGPAVAGRALQDRVRGRAHGHVDAPERGHAADPGRHDVPPGQDLPGRGHGHPALAARLGHPAGAHVRRPRGGVRRRVRALGGDRRGPAAHAEGHRGRDAGGPAPRGPRHVRAQRRPGAPGHAREVPQRQRARLGVPDRLRAASSCPSSRAARRA